MDRLKAYWIRPEFSTVRFVKNIDESWSEENGGVISPAWFKANYPGVCLFSKLEIGRNCWVKVWFYHSDLAALFRKEETREAYSYWVDPTWLVELPISQPDRTIISER